MERVPELLQHLFRNDKPFNQSCKIVNLLLQSINLRKRRSRRLITSGLYFLSTSLWNSSNCLEITGFAFSRPCALQNRHGLGFIVLLKRRSSIHPDHRPSYRPIFANADTDLCRHAASCSSRRSRQSRSMSSRIRASSCPPTAKRHHRNARSVRGVPSQPALFTPREQTTDFIAVALC